MRMVLICLCNLLSLAGGAADEYSTDYEFPPVSDDASEIESSSSTRSLPHHENANHVLKACREGNQEIIDELLANKAINKYSLDALMAGLRTASEFKHLEIVRRLIPVVYAKGKTFTNELMVAAEFGHQETVKKIMKLNNFKELLHQVTIGALCFWMRKPGGDSMITKVDNALLSAIHHFRADIVELLLPWVDQETAKFGPKLLDDALEYYCRSYFGRDHQSQAMVSKCIEQAHEPMLLDGMKIIRLLTQWTDDIFMSGHIGNSLLQSMIFFWYGAYEPRDQGPRNEKYLVEIMDAILRKMSAMDNNIKKEILDDPEYLLKRLGKYGSFELIELFLSHNADGKEILFGATEAGRTDIASKLFKRKDFAAHKKTLRRKLFHLAAINGHLKLAEKFVKFDPEFSGAFDPDAEEFNAMVRNGWLPMIKNCRDYGMLSPTLFNGQSLLSAAESPNLETFQFICSRRHKIWWREIYGLTLTAARNNRSHILEFLLTAKGKSELRYPRDFNAKRGQRAHYNFLDHLLCCAAYNGHEDIVDLLLRKKVSAHATGDYVTVVLSGPSVSKALLKSSLNPELKKIRTFGYNSYSALIYALINGHYRIAVQLLNAGAEYPIEWRSQLKRLLQRYRKPLEDRRHCQVLVQEVFFCAAHSKTEPMDDEIWKLIVDYISFFELGESIQFSDPKADVDLNTVDHALDTRF